MVDEAFGHWFAGFVDGEGCFRVKPTNMGTFQCRFSIGLRADDEPILREIRDRLGFGILVHSGRDGGKAEQWRWEVNSKDACVKLVALFRRFPLRAKKANDFEVWARAVERWVMVQNGKRSDWAVMARLAQELRDGRRVVYAAD